MYMSKNNKNARLIRDAKVRNRTKGFKGPARTTKLNTKKRAWYQLKDANGVLLCMKEKPTKGGKGGNRGRRAANDSEVQTAA
jgi:hypothetical protein